MADETSRPFDVRTIKILIRLMARNDVSELDLMDGKQRIRLRRGPRIVAGAAPLVAAPAIQPAAAPAPSAAPPSAAPTPTQAPAPAAAPSNLIEIKSSTVGTFYSQEKPETPPYVSVGSRVTPTTVVGLIEAMKVFNELFAGVSGVVREILVKNGEGVEYNQVLFRVDPSA